MKKKIRVIEDPVGHNPDILLVDSVTNNIIADVGDGKLAERRANADRLALAWNCHDELIAALEGFLHADPDVFRKELEAALAAIAKAKGE